MTWTRFEKPERSERIPVNRCLPRLAKVEYITGSGSKKYLRFRFSNACGGLFPEVLPCKVSLYSNSSRLGILPDEQGDFSLAAARRNGKLIYFSLYCNPFLVAQDVPAGATFDVSTEDGFIVLTPRQEEVAAP